MLASSANQLKCDGHQLTIVSSHPPRTGRSSERLGSHPWLVVVAWAVFLLAATPLAVQYTHSINYAGSAAGLSGTESQRAADLLASVAPSHSTLLVVIDQASLPPTAAANETLAFQRALAASALPYLNASSSAYSVYAAYLDGLMGSELSVVRSTYNSTANLTSAVYQFPARFLAVWQSAGATSAAINSSYAKANGSVGGYEAAIRDWLLPNFSARASPSSLVQGAVVASAPRYFAAGSALNLTLTTTNVTGYGAAVAQITDDLIGASGGRSIPVEWVEAAHISGDFGANYVAQNGLSGVPSTIRASFVSPDGAVSLVLVTFTVPDSFRTADGTYPAQSATPTVRSLAARSFGSSAQVTGPGAFAYDSQQISSASGFLFALTFLFLGIAVALTLRSWIAPLLALLLISASTLLGYLAIELTGALVGKVDFTVTYTLTAVTLGVATDYALFFLYRYREELTKGESAEAALRTAQRSSGFAILVSAATVAIGLGTLSFLSGLATWGPVLFVTILAVGLLEVTLLPAVARLIGPRLFIRRWLRPAVPPERSIFYRAAARSGSRAVLVGLLALGIAVPVAIGFLTVPTSYDFTGGLPAGTGSAEGQALLEQHFGANLLYPIDVVVPARTTFLEPNGSLTPEGATVLPAAAADLVHRPGVAAVYGPFVTGTNLTSTANATGNAGAYLLDGGKDAYFQVYSLYAPYSPSALQLVESIRSNSTYVVGGLTSSVVDQQAQNNVEYPLLEVLLTVFVAVILGVAFRSVWVPLISISGVFLSIAGTTSLLYLIAVDLLHAPFLWLVPLVLFVLLMSLGNDYTVFLLTRVREEQAQYGPFEGIRRGIAGSGVVVSALGLILAASLGSLALQPISFLQEIGIAFVISLVLDTFVVRPFYFPAMLTLVERHAARGRGAGPIPAPSTRPPA
jgi:RND superfamily putative drug exporter